MSPYVPLKEALEKDRFGGKAASLSVAIGHGWPVPGGFAIEADTVERLLEDGPLRSSLAEAHRTGGLAEVPVAVRSSAIGEDSASASFAGQHLTVLHVVGGAAVLDATIEVWRSARTEAALAYRSRLGIVGQPRMAVVVQRMLQPDIAGVLFTKNPVSGADERVVEAAWGLGEIVVAGLVTPDSYRWARGSASFECRPGEKDIAIRGLAGGGTHETEVAPELVHAPCLDARMIAELEALAVRVEATVEGPHDIEWAIEGGRLHLLQRRAVTR